MGIILGVIEDSGATLIYVTHDPSEAVQLSGRIIELRGGRIVGEVEGKRHAMTVSYE
jgi:ABC-type proline/glycine betaine transport system ATPase subunit